MTEPRYLQLDVFPARRGGGNPLGVVIGAEGWSVERMQAFAAWTDLVETTFVLSPTSKDASYRLRIFTPTREIPFAGHPTIGSAHAIIQTGFAVPHEGLLIQECGAGLLPIRIEGELPSPALFVQAPAAHMLPIEAPDETLLRSALGDAALGALPPAFVDGGRRWWIAEFARESDLRGWHPDHAAIGALARASDSMGLCVFARSDSPDHELVVRAFPAGVGIVEDPASGAANGLIGAWIASAEPEGALANGYRVSQGREIGRDAAIRVRIEHGDGTARVWVGGEARTIVDGRVDWPD
jgi:PhzF family phenazine biosynthesis protein